eukprot:9481850-Pyramimonas_sp.AAC.1
MNSTRCESSRHDRFERTQEQDFHWVKIVKHEKQRLCFDDSQPNTKDQSTPLCRSTSKPIHCRLGP